MSLDILTLKGQESWRDEQRLAAWLEQNFKFRYVQTPKHVSATVDAVLIGANHALIGVAETKCRYNLDMNEFKTAFKQEWLMTWNKVNYAMKIATGLGVPLVGFLFLVKPSVVLVQRISNPNGELVAPIRLQTTTTKATINGGYAVRTNAFIDMSAAKFYEVNK
jgi:hypothetical protein